MRFNFKLKLIGLFLLVCTITNSIFFVISYNQSEKMLRSQIESTALSISSSVASTINGDELEKVVNEQNSKSSIYNKLETNLRKLRDINRRDDVYVKFLYTLHPSKKDKNVVLFGVDSEEDGPDKSSLGEVYKQKESPDIIPTVFDKNQVQPVFVEDQWGSWLSANSPIFNSKGESVGALGVDIDAKDVIRSMDKLLYTGIYSLIISIIISFIISYIFSNKINKPISELIQFIKLIGEGKKGIRIDLNRSDEFEVLANALNDAVYSLEHKKVLNDTLVRYLSCDVFEKISTGGTEIPILKGERRKITVMFSDFRGFTTLSETLKPELVFELLNEYFEKMVEAVHENNGIVNKFLGDGIMAIFGSVKDDAEQEENAIKAALQMEDAVNEVNKIIYEKYKKTLKVGIGINTGMALVGNVGSSSRMEFTAIGDTVNLASRIESKTKDYDCDIIISEYTYVEAKNSFKFECLGKSAIKGRKEEVSLYKLI